MHAAVRLRYVLSFALAAAGCSGSPTPPVPASTPMPSPSPSPSPASVASLSIALAGTPTFATMQPAATYPIVLKAFRSDGTLITGTYAQQVIVELISPACNDFGLTGGAPPVGIVYVPIGIGVCGPGMGSAFSATAVTSSATALALTWNGIPASSSGELEAYATGAPTTTFALP